MTRFGKGYKLKRLLFKEPLVLNYLYLLLTFQLTANVLPKRSVGTPSLVVTVFFNKLVFIVKLLVLFEPAKILHNLTCATFYFYIYKVSNKHTITLIY
jgi:hypothetical protein